MSLKDPKNAWESDPIFGLILLITLGLIIPIPMALIASLFGWALGPWVWIAMCASFWTFEIHMATKPFDRYKRS